MRIDVNGRTWTVEPQEAPTLAPATGRDYFGLRFLPEDGPAEEATEMRWIPRPRNLTREMAARLFLLAGERQWRDPRDGTSYRVVLESGLTGDEEERTPAPAMRIRFTSRHGSVSTEYDLDRPLGLATSQELAQRLDRAAAPDAQRSAARRD